MSVLITGGTKGIGKACAERFIAEGHAVHVSYAGDEVAAEACAQELGCGVHRCDQGDPDSVATLWQCTAGLLGRCHNDIARIIAHELPLADWQRAFDAIGEREAIKAVLIP